MQWMSYMGAPKGKLKYDQLTCLCTAISCFSVCMNASDPTNIGNYA